MTQHGAVTLPAARAPFPVTAPHRVVPAPRPLASSAAVELDDAWPAVLARRLERLDTDPARRRLHGNRGPSLQGITSIADDLVRWLRSRVS